MTRSDDYDPFTVSLWLFATICFAGAVVAPTWYPGVLGGLTIWAVLFLFSLWLCANLNLRDEAE